MSLSLYFTAYHVTLICVHEWAEDFLVYMQLNLEDKSFLCLLDFNLRFPIIPSKYVGRSTWSVMIKVQFSFQIMTTMNPNFGYFMYETSHYMLALCTNHIHLKSGIECIKSGVFTNL